MKHRVFTQPGSKGDISVVLTYVCFSSESRHRLSTLGCPPILTQQI